jgi:sulfide dehydrogenase cytochrome subunit
VWLKTKKVNKRINMKKIVLSLVVMVSLSYATNYNKHEATMLSLSCASCHGTDGKSPGSIPSIGGASKEYLYKALLDYKSGKRYGTVMMKHAKGFSDNELEQIAYYFSKVK